MEYSIATREDTVWKFVSPYIYRVNAFRIAGLTVDADNREISARIHKLELLQKYNSSSHDFSGPLPLQPPPDNDVIREALHHLKDPEKRLLDEFFWFLPLDTDRSSKNDEALKALSRNDVEGAKNIWSANVHSVHYGDAAVHNLTVLNHVSALDLEYKESDNGKLTHKEINERALYWSEALTNWKILFNNTHFWFRFVCRVRDLNDPRLSEETVESIREAIPAGLLYINGLLALRAAEKGNDKDAQRHIAIIQNSTFDIVDINKALDKVAQPVVTRIQALCNSAAKDENHEQALEKGKTLINNTKQLLNIIRLILPKNHPTREMCHDEVALAALGCGISYGNHSKNWMEAKILLKETMTIALSSSAEMRIQENLDIIQRNIEYALTYETCFFCQQNPTHENAEIAVTMHGNVRRTNTELLWNYRTVKVPRCSECRSAQERVYTYSFAGGLGLGTLTALCGYIWTGFAENTTVAIILIAVLSILGFAIGNHYGIKMLKGTKGESKRDEFIEIKELLSEGWAFGDRPAEANQ